MSIPNVILERQPAYLAPVNKELWFEASSTASNSQDFKYLWQILAKNEPFEINQYINFSTIYKVPPRPSDGHGFFTPHQVIKALFQFYPSPFQQGWKTGVVGAAGVNPGVLDNYFEYKVNYGFEYTPNLSFTRTYNYLGNVGLSFSTAQSFNAGDIVTIEMTNQFINTAYNGTASILGSQSVTQWITDIPFGTAVANESGTIVNLRRISASSSSRYTYNGTRQYHELNEDFTKYLCGYTASQAYFMTEWDPNVPKQVYVGLTSGLHAYETFSILCATPTQSRVELNFYQEDGTLVTGLSVVLPTNNRYRRLDFGIGPQNLVDEFGNLIDWTDPLLDKYTAVIKSGVATQSKVYTWKVKRYCDQAVQGFTNYELTTILWLNRVGGWDYFGFIKDKKKKVDIQKNYWVGQLPIDYTYGAIYTRAQRGRTTLNNFAEETFEVMSDWIDDYTSSWLQGLFTSTEAYVVINGTYSGGDPNDPTQFTGRIAPINIVNNSYEVQNTLRNKMFNVSVTYQMSFPLNLQNQ